MSEEVKVGLRNGQPYLLQAIRECINNNNQLSLFSPMNREKGINDFLNNNDDPLYDLSFDVINASKSSYSGINDYDLHYLVAIDFIFTDLRSGKVFCKSRISGSSFGRWSTPNDDLVRVAIYRAAEEFEDQLYSSVFPSPGMSPISAVSMFGTYVSLSNFATSEPRSSYSEKHLDKLFSQIRSTLKKAKGLKQYDINQPDKSVLDLVEMDAAKLFTIDAFLADFQYNTEEKIGTCRMTFVFTDVKTNKPVHWININVKSDTHSSANAAMNEVIKRCVKDFDEYLKRL